MITPTYKPTAREKKRYLLKEGRDIEILAKCREIQNRKLTEEDRTMVELILTQLEDDWRTPLLIMLNKLAKKTSENNLSKQTTI